MGSAVHLNPSHSRLNKHTHTHTEVSDESYFTATTVEQSAKINGKFKCQTKLKCQYNENVKKIYTQASLRQSIHRDAHVDRPATDKLTNLQAHHTGAFLQSHFYSNLFHFSLMVLFNSLVSDFITIQKAPRV